MFSTSSDLKKTALNRVMLELGGKMTSFFGWELPTHFGGILNEHKSVRNSCGVFDVSHMGNIFVEGRDAYKLVQMLNSNDVKPIEGRGVYSHLTNEQGGVIDDVIAFCINAHKFYIVVNCATTSKDYEWFCRNAKGLNVKITNASEDYQMIALQGPKSLALIEEICLDALKLARFHLLETKLAGSDCIITRTGYTGEDGFEIAGSPKAIIEIFALLMDKGKKYGIAPCGLGARDTLRLEAGYLLYGQDIDETHTPYEAGYGWVVKLNKDIDFIGKSALIKQKERGLETRLTGFVLTERAIARSGYEINKGGKVLGRFTSATFSPTLKKSIGVGYVPANISEGDEVTVTVHLRQFKAVVSTVPFYENRV